MTDWVVIHTVQGEFEEDQLRAFLAANGVETHVRGEALRKTHAFVLDGLGEVEILVHERDVDKARDLVARVEAGELAITDEEPLP